MKTNLITLSLLLLLLGGCSSMKPTTGGKANGGYETFFVGEAGTQYFIKPMSFEGAASKAELLLDITFRYKDEIKDSAELHLSIISPDIYKTLQGVQLSTETGFASSEEISLMLNETTKKAFLSRFSAKVSLKDLHQTFSGEQWNMMVKTDNGEMVFTPTKKTQKSLINIRNKVFILM